MPTEERELHNKGLSEDTLAVLRDGGTNGNEIRKNSIKISKHQKTYIHITISLDKQ
jgi:hypothetical protein